MGNNFAVSQILYNFVADYGKIYKHLITKKQTKMKKLLTLFALLLCAVTSSWADTVLFTTNFSTTDGWTNESIITSTTTSATRTIKGTTISFAGYKSSDCKISDANATGGTLTFTKSNLAASAGDVTNSNPNYYMAIPVTGVVGGMVTVTITTGSGYKPYYTYDDGSNGSVVARQQAAENNTFTIEGLTSDKVTIYLGTSAKTMTSLTISTPVKADLTTSTFYATNKQSSDAVSASTLIEDASLPAYITINNCTSTDNGSNNTSTVTTPFDFSTIGNSKFYRLKPGTSSSIVVGALSHVKSIRLYGNGNGSTGNIKVAVKKLSGTGTAMTVADKPFANSKSTIVEYSTGDLTAMSGYDADTYYIYTISFTANFSLWGFYVEYAAPTGPVDPSFSLTKTSISTEETSQIKVEGKNNLDGITLSNITYGTSGIVTVDATGVVSPIAKGTTTISFNSSAVDGKYNAGSGNLSITVTAPQVAIPTLTASGYFTESKSVEISCTTEGAAIQYSYDNTNWTAYTVALNITETKTVYAKATKSGYTDSEVASATYTKVTPHTWATVDAATVWDWSKLTTSEVQLTDGTTPTKAEEFLMGDMNGEVLAQNIGYGDGVVFNADALKAILEYPVRSKSYAQGNQVKFKTSVPGYVTVRFSNTGGNGSNRPYRYAKVNDTMSANGSADGTMITSEAIHVDAGEVTIIGYIPDATDPASRDGDNVGAAQLRISKITFTPEAISVTAAEWATATTPAFAVDFDANAKVYIATAAGDNITLTKITDAPANTPVIVNAPSGSYTMTPKATATADVSGNKLKSSDGSIVGTATNSPYVLGKKGEWVGFAPLAEGTTLAAGKAYILASAFSGAKEFYPFYVDDETGNETTGINQPTTCDLQHATTYNLAGQKVGKDYKGIVIINGKKYLNK